MQKHIILPLDLKTSLWTQGHFLTLLFFISSLCFLYLFIVITVNFKYYKNKALCKTLLFFFTLIFAKLPWWFPISHCGIYSSRISILHLFWFWWDYFIFCDDGIYLFHLKIKMEDSSLVKSDFFSFFKAGVSIKFLQHVFANLISLVFPGYLLADTIFMFILLKESFCHFNFTSMLYFN